MRPSEEPAADGIVSIARAALTAYDLPPITHLRLISDGNNATFEVNVESPVGKRSAGSPTRYALRIHRAGFRTAAHTLSELRFLQLINTAFAGTHVVVPRPVVARNGSPLVDVDDGAGVLRRCDLLSWVDGEVLVPGRGLGPRAVHSLGRALALLHNAAERFEPAPDFDLPRWDADGMFTTSSFTVSPHADARGDSLGSGPRALC